MKTIFVCYMKSICGYYSLASVINAVVVAIDVISDALMGDFFLVLNQSHCIAWFGTTVA